MKAFHVSREDQHALATYYAEYIAGAVAYHEVWGPVVVRGEDVIEPFSTEIISERLDFDRSLLHQEEV